MITIAKWLFILKFYECANRTVNTKVDAHLALQYGVKDYGIKVIAKVNHLNDRSGYWFIKKMVNANKMKHQMYMHYQEKLELLTM